MTDEEGKQ